MLKELQDIATADVEALAAIKAEDDVVRTLIEKANASREKVPGVIYERVMGDYDARLKALDAQARPLRQTAWAELAKLKALHARLAAGLESARLDLSELEFRHEIGELTAAEFEEKRAGAQEALVKAQADFDDADRVSRRFLEVLPAEADVAPPPEPPPPPEPVAPPPSSPAPPVPGAPPPEEGATGVTVTQIPRPRDAEEDMGTIAVSAEEARALTASPAYGTLVMPSARLVRDDDGAEGPTFILGAVATLGRTPDNSIPLDKPEVSRKHARIILGQDGAYTLIDNGSNNGTFVNGDKITERRLIDGDRIQIGTHSFWFRQSAPNP